MLVIDVIQLGFLNGRAVFFKVWDKYIVTMWRCLYHSAEVIYCVSTVLYTCLYCFCLYHASAFEYILECYINQMYYYYYYCQMIYLTNSKNHSKMFLYIRCLCKRIYIYLFLSDIVWNSKSSNIDIGLKNTTHYIVSTWFMTMNPRDKALKLLK